MQYPNSGIQTKSQLSLISGWLEIYLGQVKITQDEDFVGGENALHDRQLLGVFGCLLHLFLEIGLQLEEGVKAGFRKGFEVLEEGVKFELFGFQLEDIVFYTVHVNQSKFGILEFK